MEKSNYVNRVPVELEVEVLESHEYGTPDKNGHKRAVSTVLISNGKGLLPGRIWGFSPLVVSRKPVIVKVWLNIDSLNQVGK